MFPARVRKFLTLAIVTISHALFQKRSYAMELSESVTFEAVPSDRIDQESGIIRGVRVLGSISRNNRRYTDDALRDAVALYEGRGVKLDHPDKDSPNRDRSVLEQFGELRNVRLDENEKAIYADHHFPKAHKFAGDYMENCVRFPKQLGFSHNAEGECKLDGETQIVESIADVYSVDLVDSPATNKGLFESKPRRRRRRKRKLAGVLERAEDSTQTVRTLLMEQMQAGAISPDLMVDGALEGETEDDAIKAAFRAAVMAVFDEESLDADATKKAIERIIDTGESIGQTEETEEGDEMDPEKKDKKDKKDETIESLQRELSDVKAENAVRSLLESSGVAIDEELVAALKPLSEEQRKSLIERLEKPTEHLSERPARSAPLREAAGNSKWSKAIAKATT